MMAGNSGLGARLIEFQSQKVRRQMISDSSGWLETKDEGTTLPS